MKRMKLDFYNEFTNEYLGGCDFAYNRMKMVNGWYSRWVKRMKKFLAEEWKVDPYWVRLKITKVK